MAEGILCSIVIVYYDDYDKMLKCLKSIETYSPVNSEVIIVNNSPNQLPFAVSGRKYLVIGDGINYGYAKANNIGMSWAKGEYILLLNPDAELTDQFIEKSIALLKKSSNIAAVGPKLVDDYDNTQQSAFRFPTLKDYLVNDILLLNKDKSFSSFLDKSECISSEDNIFGCDWLSGAAVMARRKVLEDVKGFDTRYFLYFEDVDMFKKIRDRRWEVVYSPSYTVKHYDKDEKGIYSEKFNNAKRVVAYDFSVLQYWHKHEPDKLPIVRFLVFLRALSRLLAWVFLPSLKKYAGSRNRRERIKGYCNSLLLSVIK